MFAAVSDWSHSRGIRFLRYLDDWLVLASSEAVAKKNVHDHSLGIVIKRGEVRSCSLADCKLPWYDHRYRDHQDFSCPGEGGEISVGGGEVSYFVRSPHSAMAGAFGAPGVAGEVGSSQSSSHVLLQWHLKTHWSPELDLSRWRVRDYLLQGVRFGTPPPDLHLYSDASRSGWGTHLLDRFVSGVWS